LVKGVLKGGKEGKGAGRGGGKKSIEEVLVGWGKVANKGGKKGVLKKLQEDALGFKRFKKECGVIHFHSRPCWLFFLGVKEAVGWERGRGYKMRSQTALDVRNTNCGQVHVVVGTLLFERRGQLSCVHNGNGNKGLGQEINGEKGRS